MRVVSLVPSITETLIESGVEVVGRTRFCVHPGDAVPAIPRVGGTKGVDWKKVLATGADLVVLDKEENTLEMAQSCPLPYQALHITSLGDISGELAALAETLASRELREIAKRWHKLSSIPPLECSSWTELPGVADWIQLPVETIETVEYLIWRDPWMAIGPGTFVHAMLTQVGLGQWLPKHPQKYPQVDLSGMNRNTTLLLFSSEPFPFARHVRPLKQLGFAGAIIDGERFSWYGLRSLEFLERLYQRSPSASTASAISPMDANRKS